MHLLKSVFGRRQKPHTKALRWFREGGKTHMRAVLATFRRVNFQVCWGKREEEAF